MNHPVAARTAMQSALEQWSAIDKLADIAKKVLSPEEVERVEAPLRKTADECLQALSVPPSPEVHSEYGEEDITEVVVLRSTLRRMSTKYP